LRFRLLRCSKEQLLTRYSDGKEHGGCPLAQYFKPQEFAGMFMKAGFNNIRQTTVSGGPLSSFVRLLGFRRALEYKFIRKADAMIETRLGLHLVLQAKK
jgi:hypothetical protein